MSIILQTLKGSKLINHGIDPATNEEVWHYALNSDSGAVLEVSRLLPPQKSMQKVEEIHRKNIEGLKVVPAFPQPRAIY